MSGRKILSLVLAVIIAMPVTAFAEGNGKSSGNSGKGKEQQTVQTSKVQSQPDNKDKGGNVKTEQDNVSSDKTKDNEHKQDAMQKKDEKQQQIETFKTEMRTKHDEMKDIREQTIALKKLIAQKRAQLAALAGDLEDGSKTLTEDMLNQLIGASQNILTDVEQVNATAEITDQVSDTQNKVNNGDFNNALTSMDGVIVKLLARLEALKQLDADLDKALEIANGATTPSPTTGTGDGTTTPAPTTGAGGQTTTPAPTTGTSSQTTTTTTGTGDQTTTTTGDQAQTTTAATTEAQNTGN